MSEAVSTPQFVTPEQEQAAKGANTPDPYDMSIEDINPLNAHLFCDNRWQEVFERLRKEDPVHFNEIETAGRYWSLTKYKDIKAVDADWKRFSSAQGITLGIRPEAGAPASFVEGSKPPFISQDPPQHDDLHRAAHDLPHAGDVLVHGRVLGGRVAALAVADRRADRAAVELDAGVLDADPAPALIAGMRLADQGQA